MGNKMCLRAKKILKKVENKNIKKDNYSRIQLADSSSV